MTLFDLCIVGGGPAGITLASDLIQKKPKLKICLIESGNLTRESSFKNKYLKNFTELKHINKIINPVEDNRLFLFGGTTNHWGGWCRPLDFEDFNTRLGYSKNYWPLNKTEIDKYANQSKKTLELKNTFDLDPTQISFDEIQKKNFDLEEINFDFSNQNVFYDKYKELKKKININLNLIAYKFIIDEEKNYIRNLECINSLDKEKKMISAKYFVIAAGAIETTRFLLNNNNFYKQNYFNKSGLLGKGFNDHPHFPVGDFVSFKNFHKDKNIFLKNNFNFQLKNQILNSSLRLIKDNSIRNKLIRNFKNLFLKLDKKILYTGSIYCISEMEVRDINKIVLSKDRRDDFGIPQIDFHFSFSDRDLDTIKIPAINMAKFLTYYNFGRVRLKDWIIDKNINPFFEGSNWVGHHMSTTRIGEEQNLGIVDKNLKLFNLKNGYILSSSVFPTGGASNPTFTIVSLAHRMSDYFEKII